MNVNEKNIIVVTGGAGFVGSNLILSLIKFKKYKIISIDNYSSGSKKNHIKNPNIKYIKEDTINNFNRIKDVKDGFGYARQLTAILSSKNRIKKVKSIKAKTLLIHGEQDPVLNVKNSHLMNKLIPDSNLIVIPNMRHLIEEEILDQFKDKLKIHLTT